MSIEAMKQALEVYCKTLHPLWNTRISRTEAEGFFEAGFKAATAEAHKQVAFKIYKPTPPRHATPNVRNAELPWVYDQDPSSGNVASMWVTPVKATPPQRTEQNFCPRCGKRTKDLTHIHTCTPPREGT
jgi:hypothetical protein